EKAFEKDPASYYKKSFSNESMLGAIFSSNNLTEKSLYWEKMSYLRHQNDPRTGYNYANVLVREGKINEAIQIYESSVTKFPAYALPYVQLVDIYLKNKDYDALYRLLLKMEGIYKENPAVFTSRLSREQIDSCFDILNQLKSMIGDKP
ncbi:MAG: tetratricopeptide repeat protein, partial [Dysgonamonadaceae bacterium]|nr:tetratricopeptide repeat protein [Dysgonamonadaceae bacterium]